MLASFSLKSEISTRDVKLEEGKKGRGKQRNSAKEEVGELSLLCSLILKTSEGEEAVLNILLPNLGPAKLCLEQARCS